MNRILKTAIFVMAMMTSAIFAFGQTQDTGNGLVVNPYNQLCVTVTASDPSNSIDYLVDNATITYRWKDGFGNWETVWTTKATADVYGGSIYFPPVCCNYTTGAGQQIEYVLRAYSGHKLIRSHCGISDVYPNAANNIIVTTWNRCLGEPLSLDDFLDDED